MTLWLAASLALRFYMIRFGNCGVLKWCAGRRHRDVAVVLSDRRRHPAGEHVAEPVERRREIESNTRQACRQLALLDAASSEDHLQYSCNDKEPDDKDDSDYPGDNLEHDNPPKTTGCG
jgi:hypothetical protein